MPSNYGHILSDDVVVNYNGTDKDDCLHFLTHIDTTCKDLSLFISPTAKRIYTSFFNAWFLKMNFDVKHIDLQGFDTNKSYKITFKGNKYIYSFIDSKFTTGSVALLLHGAFGTYLYTGNFCYYPSFLKSPVLLPVIEEKALTRLYLDNTYYEQPSNFLGFNELTTKVADLIKSQPMKNFYIYADKVSMDPFIAEIASKLEERVYVCQSTMEIMKILGYESCFTRHSNESRIFIDKAFIKKRGFGLENIAIYINRYSESCKSFQSIDKKGNVYCFNFYCHSNNKEICELLRILKPESTTFLFSEIDKSKLSYNFKFKYDFPRNVLFKGISAKPSMKAEGETSKLVKNNHIEQLNATTTININDKRACVSKNFSNERIEVSVNQELNLVERTSVNQDVTNLSKNYICPLRIRKVPEINNVGLSHELNCSTEDSNNKVAENGAYNTEIIPYNSLKEINNTEIKTSNFNVQSLSESVLNHHKPQPNNSIEYLQSSNYDSARSTLFSSNIKLLSSSFVKTKTGMPLVFNPRLVKDNGLKGKKNSIFLNKQIVDMNNTCVVTLPPKEIQRNKLKYVENRKTILTKKSLTLIKSKTADLNSNMKRPNALLQAPSDALNMTKLFHGWMDKNTVSLPNDSQTSEKRINGSEESILESQNCDQDIIELELPINNAHSNSDSSVDSVSLQPEDNINQPCGTSAIAPTEFEQHGIEQICNENNSGDHSTVTNLEKSVIDGMLSNGTTSILNKDSEVKQLDKSIEKNNENELKENNCQDIITKYTCNVTPKRRLSDDENRQSRKKLRSSHSRQQKNRTHSLRDCFVLVRRNGFERNYFYSSLNDCYLPKFCGFKKNEIRPRNMSITLRNLQKVLES